jgi:protein-tyrosine phosphatase
MMEILLRNRLPESFTVSSAGVQGLTGQAMESHAAAQLVRLGGSPSDFIARRFTRELGEGADLILTATVPIRGLVLNAAPSALKRTFALLEFAALTKRAPESTPSPVELVQWAAANRSLASGLDLDVPDPMGKSFMTHRATARLIDEGIRDVARALGAASAPR